jgi:hypothetical protein
MGKIVIALLKEGNDAGEVSDETHEVLGETLGHMQRQEYHQLRAQEKFEGKNASTDKQISICRVALPALEEAMAAYNNDDYAEVIEKVRLAVDTDGTPPRKVRAARAKRAVANTRKKVKA